MNAIRHLPWAYRLLVVALVTAIGFVGAPGAAAVLPTPGVATGTSGSLYAVSASSPYDAWAVGSFVGVSARERTLTLHWDGRGWSKIASPNVTASDNELTAVSAVSANDAWAVGWGNSSTGPLQGVILHWNGAGWSRMAMPTWTGSMTASVYLYGVSAISATNGWAVGTYAGPSTGGKWRSLILHWNGTAWRKIGGPSPADPTTLTSVDALSARSAWAAGSADGRTFVVRWNGTAWSRVPTPNANALDNSLFGVSGASSNDVWAVGSYYTRFAGTRTLVLHWNGSGWTRVASPNSTPKADLLNAVSAASANEAWAVGIAWDSTISDFRALTLRWDGTTWSEVQTANLPPSSHGYWLNGVSATSPSNVWAAGYFNYGHALVLHWNGTAWTVG